MVEWKKLGEVCKLERGVRVVKKNLKEEGLIPVYQNSLTPLGYYDKSNYPEHTCFVICAGAAGEVGFSNKAFWAADDCTCVVCPPLIHSTFIYYYLMENQHLLKTQVRKASVPRLSKDVIGKLLLPIPSLSEQQRIVSILDTFTSSISNLKQQIEERRKQYEYERDLLLDLEGKDEKDIHSWGESCEIKKGNGVQKADFVEEGIGCIHYGQIYTYYGAYTYTTNKFVAKETFEKAKKASKGDIIMTDTSENVEDICKSVAYLGEDDIAVSNHALILKHHQNPLFLSFSTQTNSFLTQKRKVVVGAKVSCIKPEHFAQIKIYLPSLEEQSRIVSILDTFEQSISNLEEQLAMREKQYEYYRNQLLTFEGEEERGKT